MRRRHHAESLDNSPNTSSFSVLGFKVERKFDIIATTAFILALVGAITQVFSFLRGSNVSFYRPDNIILFFDPYPNGDIMMRIAATLNYVNSGEASYGAIIRKETVQFRLRDRTYQQTGSHSNASIELEQQFSFKDRLTHNRHPCQEHRL
jgi:hypothetical protein